MKSSMFGSLLALTVVWSGMTTVVLGQSSARRDDSGWTASPVAGTTDGRVGRVQTAYYLPQQQLYDGLPVLPAAAPSAGGSSGNLPPLPGPLPNRGASNGMSDGGPQMPGPVLPAAQSGVLPAAPPPQNRVQPSVLPAGNNGSAGAGFPPSTGQPSASQATYQPRNGPSYGQTQTPAASQTRQPQVPAQTVGHRQGVPTGQDNLRAINRHPSQVQVSPGRLDPRAFASGLPYVTPAPGRYATSPYNHALFQTAAYQTTGATNANQALVGGSTIRPISQRSTLTTASLPSTRPAVPSQFASTPVAGGNAMLAGQSRIQPGIYPTAAYQCADPVPSFPSTGVNTSLPGTYAPATLTPNLTPGLYSPNNSGYAPLFSLGQENYNVQLGRGIIGQPTVYVPGQPVRNFLRYLSP